MLTSSTWSCRSTVAGRSLCDDILRRDTDEQEICPERFPSSTAEREAALSVSYGSRWRSVVAVRDASLFAVGVAGTGAAIGERRAIRRTSLVDPTPIHNRLTNETREDAPYAGSPPARP
jgi:hypothetical protein